jgi:2'-5' RNA ligase
MDSRPSQRVFVGIKISSEITEACLKLQAELGNFPARFVPIEDIHLTLMPPWEMTDQKFIEDKLRSTIKPIKRFSLKFQRLAFGPDDMRPRLVWIECEATKELIQLKKSLLKSFHEIEHVPFSPHITIARIPTKDIDKARRNRINKPLGLSMIVESVELFASPHKGGEGYKVLASVPMELEHPTPR